MRNMLNAEQAALRLGVKLPTIYAYVSRGLLQRTLAPDGHQSRFAAAEVDRLARRGRPRIGSAPRGVVEVSLATSITRIEPSRLSYRGHDTARLAGSAAVSGSTFEPVAELLWTGELAEAPDWSAPKSCLEVVARLRKSMPLASTPLDRFAVTAAAIAPLFPLRTDLQPASVLAHARLLEIAFVEALPLIAGEKTAKRSAAPNRAAAAPGLAGRLWPRLTALAQNDLRTNLLDAALILLADHELATSTMAARVAASVGANPFAVVLAGIGALNGPLHGSAAVFCHRLLLDARATSAELAIAQTLAQSGSARSLHGFGHPVYREEDPRAVQLLSRLFAHSTRSDRALIEAVIASATSVSGAPPNVDFALAAFAFAMQMPLYATQAIFALARTAGWIAHALEEYGEQPLRFRARAIYVGK